MIQDGLWLVPILAVAEPCHIQYDPRWALTCTHSDHIGCDRAQLQQEWVQVKAHLGSYWMWQGSATARMGTSQSPSWIILDVTSNMIQDGLWLVPILAVAGPCHIQYDPRWALTCRIILDVTELSYSKNGYKSKIQNHSDVNWNSSSTTNQ
jgi:hypothetical protein